MADADDDEKCFGDTLPSFEPCDESFAEQCREKISSDKSLAPFYQNKCTFSQQPVPTFDMLHLLHFMCTFADITQASVLWDKFYNRNTVNFFKDRHWIMLEFHEIGANSDEPCSLFEVGCGVGNTFFPLLEKFPNLSVYAVDFAPKAIDFIKVCCIHYDCSAFSQSEMFCLITSISGSRSF
jgi:methylase of polypeptide subunit release factors